jgi:hypothetical protein
MIQLTHLKLQQVLSKMVPDGVYLDADALAEIDLGNGTNYNPQEALNMFFQTGSVIGRSMTQDGDMNRGNRPIQELNTSGKGGKIQSLIQTYNYYLQMMRDVTGLNEARDGSMPDDEEKAILENNIQMALQQQSIYLEDAIDIREVRNIKLANQLLKIRRKKKQQLDQQQTQQNIQIQAQANAESSERAAAAEMQKSQALAQTEMQIEQAKSQFGMEKMEREAQLKKELMELEFQMNMQLKQAEVESFKQREGQKEDRKDERTKIQASQQSEMIEQRKQGTAPKNFESAGFDNLGGFGLEQFEPR